MAETLTDQQVARLKKAVEARGLAAVAEELGLERSTVASIIGGLPVRDGSVLVARSNIGRVKA